MTDLMRLSVLDLRNGELEEKINKATLVILNDLKRDDKELSTPRNMTIKVEFKYNESDNILVISSDINTKLAPYKKLVAHVTIDLPKEIEKETGQEGLY